MSAMERIDAMERRIAALEAQVRDLQQVTTPWQVIGPGLALPFVITTEKRETCCGGQNHGFGTDMTGKCFDCPIQSVC